MEKSATSSPVPADRGLDRYIETMDRWPERIYCSGQRGYRRDDWTFGRMKRVVLGLCAGLVERDVGKGDAVVLIGDPSPPWIAAYFAILRCGGVVVPLDGESPRDFILHVLERTTPKLVIAEGGFLANMEGAGYGSLRLESVAEYGAESAAPESRAPLATRGETRGRSSRRDVTTGDLAVIAFTSGTTSRPKGVMLSHGNILSVLGPIEEGLASKRGLVRLFTPVRMLSVVPFSHMFGQVIGIFLPLLLGGTVFLTAESSPASLVRTIRRHRIVALITVPRIMKLLADHVRSLMEARGRGDRFLRKVDRLARFPYPLRVPFLLDIKRMLGLHFWAFIVGGAALDRETREFWRKTVYAIFQGYGLTETAPIVSLSNPFRHSRDSAGEVFPGQEVRIAGDGEILVRGSNVMVGYFEDEAATESVMDGGWLRTGDIGEIGSDGQLYLKGRKKDVIVTAGGQNVHAEDVEGVLTGIEGVRDAAVIGMPGEGGEKVHAVLILHREASAERILREANRRLQPFQRIHGYTLWEEPDFPRTPTRKVRKNLIRESLLRTGPRRPADASPPPSGVLDGFLPPQLLSKGLSKGERLGADLGLDSLDMVEVVLRVERQYGVSLDETVVTAETTVEDLESLAVSPSRIRPLPMPRWSRSPAVRFLRALILEGVILPLCRIFIRVDVSGVENLHGAGGRILCANHVSDLDPIPLLLALPRKRRRLLAPAMGLNRFASHFTRHGAEEVPSRGHRRFRGFVQGVGYNLITFLLNTFPFPQTTAYRPSMEYTGELLDDGWWILLFPEGRLGENGSMSPFKGGIGRLAAENDAIVHPVRIDGMGEVFPQGARFPRIGRVRVAFGPPVRYGGEEASRFASLIQEGVRSLGE